MGNREVTLITDISFLHHSEQCLELLHYLLRPGALNCGSHTHMAHACIRGHAGHGFLGEFFLIQTEIKILFHTRDIMLLDNLTRLFGGISLVMFGWNQWWTGFNLPGWTWVACRCHHMSTSGSFNFAETFTPLKPFLIFYVGKINLNVFYWTCYWYRPT